MLHALSEKKRSLFHDQFISTERDVLFESTRNGKLLGHTDNYIKVEVEIYISIKMPIRIFNHP